MGTEIANFEERLAAMAKQATQVERPSSSTIGVRAGILKYAGNPVPGNKLDCIIIASSHANLYYTGAFDEDNLSNPVCYAYSPDGENMVPHPSAPEPQHTDCKTCPHNQWGSAEKGRGKACKNSRHLAMVPASVTPEDVQNCEIAVLKLPVMSVKNWSNYVHKLATLYNKPPLGVVTTIGTVPHERSQFQITFTDKGLVETPLLPGLFDRIDSGTQLLEREYDPNPEPSAQSEEEKPAKKKKF